MPNEIADQSHWILQSVNPKRRSLHVLRSDQINYEANEYSEVHKSEQYKNIIKHYHTKHVLVELASYHHLAIASY